MIIFFVLLLFQMQDPKYYCKTQLKLVWQYKNTNEVLTIR